MARIVGVGVVVLCALVLAHQGAAAVWDLFRAGTMDVQVSGADLLERCGYDRFEAERRGEPDEDCAPLIRESLRAAGTRGTVKALIDGHSRGRVCVGGLLELSDDELARTYAGWAKRHRYVERDILPAEMLINLVLMDQYLCRTRDRRHG